MAFCKGDVVVKKLALIVCLGLSWKGAIPCALAKPTQGALFSVVMTGQKGPRKLLETEKIAQKTEVCFYVQALKKPCVAVVAGFNRPGSQASPAFPARLLEVASQAEKMQTFTLPPGLPPTDLYVTILDPNDPQVSKVRGWVGSWSQDSKRYVLHKQLTQWFGFNGFGMTQQGALPEELGGVSPTSAQVGHPPQPSGSGLPKIEAQNHRQQPAPAPAVPLYDWKKEANWVDCAAGRPAVFIYRVTPSTR
jgi:hypothetical protein